MGTCLLCTISSYVTGGDECGQTLFATRRVSTMNLRIMYTIWMIEGISALKKQPAMQKLGVRGDTPVFYSPDP